MKIVRDKLGRFVRGKESWNKGISPSGATKRKLSKSHKAKYKKGYKNPFKDKKHSVEIRKKISEKTREAMKNPEIKKKISLAHKGKHKSPGTEFKKGLIHSEEWKKKQSERFKGIGNPFYGKIHTKEIRARLSKIFSGKNNHFWKGGVSPINKRIRRSKKFRDWRENVFKRDNYTCQICGFLSGQGKHIDLHPHHIKLFSEFPKFRFDVNNGITLCKNCHQKLHSNKFAEKQGVK